jgi:hypothetical protein
MTRVILDATTRAKLPGELGEALEICDESGRLLGHYTPVTDSAEREFEMPPLSDEELQRRLKEPSFSTAEVLAHLDTQN